MRYFSILILITAFLGSAYAFDLGTQPNHEKPTSPMSQNSGTPHGRQGGEDMATAFQISELPFNDTGNTVNNVDDYDEVCPYSGSTAPDVVYSYQVDEDMVLSVDLCGSSYDTKTYIYEGSDNLVFCNDDAYFDDVCGTYVSLIEAAYLLAGHTYYFVVDGYGTAAGDYILNIDEFIPAPPCVVTCNGVNEGEPELGPGYEDAFNGGCNSPEFDEPWGDLTSAGSINGNLIFCGTAGWADPGRDTDWFYLMIGEFGQVEITVDAEQPLNVYQLTGNCADGISVFQSLSVGPCAPGTMTVDGNPGEVFMMWFGTPEFTPPPGFVGYEFNYIADFYGLAPSTVSTSSTTIDHIKSLYR